MRNWGILGVSFVAFVAVASGVACGRTGLLLDDDAIGPGPTDDGGFDANGDADAGSDAPDLDGAPPPTILVGDAEVANDQQIATGEAHACLRTTAGEVWCWGANELGQLGDGTKTNRPSAKKVEGLPSIVRVATGTHHTCALAVDESLWCWGGNTQGESGIGTMGPDPVFTPTKLKMPGVIGVSAGGYHTCAYDVQGTVYCWGRNIFGECGAQGMANVVSPKKVPGLDTVSSVALGWEHTCSIMTDRTVQCWGRNQDGQIGNATSGSNEIDPAVAVGVTDARALFGGDDHTCAILGNGSMQCWGDNENGELGAGSAFINNKAVPVIGMSGAYQGGAGREHTCVATAKGDAFCWGSNIEFEVGIGPSSVIAKIPVHVLDLVDARWIAAGEAFSCAAHKKQGAQCWGKNDRGQLGGGTINEYGDSPGHPTEVKGL